MNQSLRGGPRFVVRRSPVHGRGLFAIRTIAAGALICEYKGTRVKWQDVQQHNRPGEAEAGHTFLFDVEHGLVIDGSKGGNSARWLNHSCSPNCEAELSNNRIFIYALRAIAPGEELALDYALVVDERHSRKVCEQYLCRCASPECRGTMLEKRRKATKLQERMPRSTSAGE
ncbi:SET domain-containing protein [Paraburkholderia sp. GAS199]|uniref:SET domain-containing protein n=1 Tax=Paraburkholderia sp. GAS199 TaxID=3035126 RepID=UPI003D1B720B